MCLLVGNLMSKAHPLLEDNLFLSGDDLNVLEWSLRVRLSRSRGGARDNMLASFQFGKAFVMYLKLCLYPEIQS